MKLNALNRSFSSIVQNQITSLSRRAAGHQWLNQPKLAGQRFQHTTLPKRPHPEHIRPKLSVEEIEVSADQKFMYCKGCLRSQGVRSRTNVVVAVEWLDENRKALNTDWKRIEMHLNGKAVPLLPNTLRSFVVKAPLDRRVKWAKAYAFSGNN